MKLLILIILFSFSAHAEFENTKWGMNLNDLRMIYQNGNSESSTDAIVEYFVYGPVGLYRDAVTTFVLKNDKLINVIVTLKSYESKSECKESLKFLVSENTIISGTPEIQGNDLYLWDFKNKSLLLTTITKKDQCSLVKVYLP